MSLLSMNSSIRPRILLLADRRGWAFDTNAQSLIHYLCDRFEFRIAYVREQSDLGSFPFDMILVYFWGETYHQGFIRDPDRVIKLVTSHRWAEEEEFGHLTPMQMAERYLSDAGTIASFSKRLQDILSPYREIQFLPNGFEPSLFYDCNRRQGSLTIGWAGDATDPCKGLRDILLPAAGDDFELKIAGGNFSHEEMLEFYNSVDVLCIASTAEGEPLTLIEGMASGCFPVSVDVGIVPELISHRQNGLIVNRSINAFRAAFQWCTFNVELVRAKGRENAVNLPKIRRWEKIIPLWENVLWQALNKANWEPE